MTNEELAALVKSGSSEHIEQLWQNVAAFIRQRANRIAAIPNRDHTIDFDDLVQQGYFAMLQAAKTFDPTAGKTFIGWLSFYLKRQFAVATGFDQRAKQLDPSKCASSLNAPLTDNEADGQHMDFLPDPDAQQPYFAAEAQADAERLHDDLERALATLPEHAAQILKLRFCDGLTQEETAQIMGRTKSQIATIEHGAIVMLRRHPIIHKLRNWL